jgi:outer membrane lipoprotein-sorting protein
LSVFRRFSTRRLIALVAVLAAAAFATSLAVVASGGSGPTPPATALPNAIQDALTAPAADGITARIRFTNHLLPSGSLAGGAGSPLLSGATGRLWATNDGRIRLELQSDAGDAQIVTDGKTLSVYDATSNTVYKLALPAQKTDAKDSDTPPTLAEIQAQLTKLAQYADVSGASPDSLAGQPAYTVRVAPKHDGGLLGAAELSWDATHGVPLRIAIYAQGDSTPVLALTATDISFGKVADADVDVSAPAGAKVVTVSAPAQQAQGGAKEQPVTGVDAVSAALSFKLAAPDSLVGLPRKEVRLLDSSGEKGALVVYGEGLGALVVVERPAGAKAPDQLKQLPQVSIDGATGRELATPLGTLLEVTKGGVSYAIAGSLPPAAAEAAARALTP